MRLLEVLVHVLLLVVAMALATEGLSQDHLQQSPCQRALRLQSTHCVPDEASEDCRGVKEYAKFACASIKQEPDDDGGDAGEHAELSMTDRHIRQQVVDALAKVTDELRGADVLTENEFVQHSQHDATQSLQVAGAPECFSVAFLMMHPTGLPAKDPVSPMQFRLGESMQLGHVHGDAFYADMECT